MAKCELVHYVITIIFYIIFFLNVRELTNTFGDMNISGDNSYATKAKQSLGLALIIGWSILLIILIGLILIGIMGATGFFKNYNLGDDLSIVTGEKDIYVSLRILTFSLLVFGSIIVAVLCSITQYYILDTEDPSRYSSQYNTCEAVSKLLYFHVILLCIIQGSIYLFSTFKDV